MSQTARMEDLPEEIRSAVTFMLGYIDHDQWDDALISTDEREIRQAILELKRLWSS